MKNHHRNGLFRAVCGFAQKLDFAAQKPHFFQETHIS